MGPLGSSRHSKSAKDFVQFYDEIKDNSEDRR